MHTAKSLRAIVFASLCIVGLVVIALMAMPSTRGAPAAPSTATAEATYVVSATAEPYDTSATAEPTDPFFRTSIPATINPAVFTPNLTEPPTRTPFPQTRTAEEAIEAAHTIDQGVADWPEGNAWSPEDTARITVVWTNDANNGTAFEGDGTPAAVPGYLISIDGVVRIQSNGNCGYCLFDGITYIVSSDTLFAGQRTNGPAITPTPSTTPTP